MSVRTAARSCTGSTGRQRSSAANSVTMTAICSSPTSSQPVAAVALFQQVAQAGGEHQRLHHRFEQPLLGIAEARDQRVEAWQVRPHVRRARPPPAYCGCSRRWQSRSRAPSALRSAAPAPPAPRRRAATRCPGAPAGCRRRGCRAARAASSCGWGDARWAVRRPGSRPAPSPHGSSRSRGRGQQRGDVLPPGGTEERRHGWPVMASKRAPGAAARRSSRPRQRA
jgi:hypothetical protein